jgi:hypothetical protein
MRHRFERTRSAWWTLFILAAALPAWPASPDAEVEALQMPAWIIRDGVRAPLAVGAQLRSGDQIVTGREARVLLRLAEGSMVKLGENARFSLDGIEGPGASDLFTATLGVLEGAFRFTTAPEDKRERRREVKVRFATLTVEIKGTDLWGKSSGERDIVALLEGRISVSRNGEPPIQMQQPGTYIEAPRDAATKSPAKLPPEVLARLAAETELKPGGGVARKSGRWRVYAARTASQDEALEVYDRLRAAGYPASIDPQTRDGDTLYQVRVSGLLSQSDGVVVAVKLRAELGLKDVSVSLQ